MAGHACGDAGFGIAAAVKCGAGFLQILFGRADGPFLRGEIISQVLHVLIAEVAGHGRHVRILAGTGLEGFQLRLDIGGMLTGELRPDRIDAVAIGTVAGGAHCGFLLPGIGGDSR